MFTVTSRKGHKRVLNAEMLPPSVKKASAGLIRAARAGVVSPWVESRGGARLDIRNALNERRNWPHGNPPP